MRRRERVLDKKNIDVSYFELLDKRDRKDNSLWTCSSSNEESCVDGKSEILWSREKNGAFSENDFFRSFHDDFSDLTERTTSSCSWHNDDFDMNSSNKVKASLEAIEDALYDKQPSPLITKSVFQECCDWSNKFPFLRLKGEQVIKPVDDSIVSYATPLENEPYSSGNASFSLQVEGKKMAIHVPDRIFKKSFFEIIPDLIQPPDYVEEVFDDDGEYEECFALDTGWDTLKKETASNFVNNALMNSASIESIQEKIVERIALEMWPKVVARLQKVNEIQSVVSAVVEHRRVSLRRPKTEGTELSITTDFPKLSSILSISPKILQTRRESGSWRGSQRPSRPNSEIHLSRKNYIPPSLRSKNELTKVSSFISHQNNSRQVELTGTKLMIKEENLFLPALDEDIQDSVDILRDFYEESDTKVTTTTSAIKNMSRKPECFLPPIDGKSLVSTNAKLTRNLFTLFGPPLKYEKSRIGSAARKPGSPVSRPNTSASRKALKYTGNLSHKHTNDRHSSINNSNCTDIKSSEANSEKQVTLFPIVTSLVPCKERNSSAVKKGLQNTFGVRKR